MARNDYHVIVYQLLKYLYDCLKIGKEVNKSCLVPEFFDIEDSYWEYIIKSLYEESYISGIVIVPILGGKEKVAIKDIAITPKGIQYLQENSLLSKVKNSGIVKDIISILA